ncbi:MAG: lysylphosphatidylglycerol synthase transmembrane domain-containing protein [Bacteroidetes bacterium]|nr:lysylphosphatidylglycerol synthase transmembrane domain-containing protein [Bacteroidota bacterium]
MTAKKSLTYLLFFGISAFLLYLTFKNTNLSKISESFYTLHWGYVFLCFVITMTAHFLRAWRWKLLLEPMGYKARLNTSFYAVMIGYLTNYAIPRGGELARCGVMFGTDKIPVDKLLGTVVTERIIDLLLLFVIFILTLFFEFSTINSFLNFEYLWLFYHNLFYALIGTLIAFIAVSIVFRKAIAQFGIVKKVISFLKGFTEGLLSVFKIKNQFLFWIQSIGIWVAFFFINYAFMHAMPITENVSWKVVLVVLAMGAVGFAIPTPGGAGSYHYIIKMTLMFYFLSAADAEAYALVSHTAQAVFIAFAGCISLYMAFLERKKNEYESRTQIAK